MKIYIAGPMTGYEGLNFPAFHDAARRMRECGHYVINPAEINPNLDADWTECMLEDIKQLSTCDGIYLLEGWDGSYGAQIECLVAQKLKLQIIKETECVSS